MLVLRGFILCYFYLLASPSFAEIKYCADGKMVSGKIENGGQWALFKLEGSEQKYGLSGLHLIDAKPPQGEITVYAGTQKTDRYGRLLVQAYQEGTWVQGRLLQAGKALGYGLGIRGECLAAYYTAEKIAEETKAGIWEKDTPLFAADNIESLLQRVGHFTLIEGKVTSVGDRSRRLYLNFGQKWSQDFTISLAKKGKGAFKGDVDRLKNIKNKTVRVRGILESRQGPLIRLFDESQIIILD